jgi:hypothetical protein
MNGLAFTGGFLEGINRGRNKKEIREEKLRNWRLAEELGKIRIEEGKFKMKQLATKQKLFDMLFPDQEDEQQPQASPLPQTVPSPEETTPLGDSFPQYPGFPGPAITPDQPQIQTQPQAPSVSQPGGGRLLQMLSDPRTLILLKEAGLDVTAIARMMQDRGEKTPHFIGGKVFWTDKQGNVTPGPGEFPVKREPRAEVSPTGEETTSYINPYEEQKPVVTKRPVPIWKKIEVPGEGIYEVPINPITGLPAFGDGWTGQGMPSGSIQTGPPELKEVTEATPGGGKKTFTLPKSQPFSVKTELDAAEKPKSAAEAGRSGMLLSAMREYEKFKSLVLSPDGKTVNYKNLATASSIPFKGGLPFTKGRDINSVWAQIREVPSRFNTGAAMTEEEAKNFEIQFKPSAIDSPELVKDKLARLKTYATGVWTEMFPGRKIGSSDLVVPAGGKVWVISPENKTTARDPIEERIKRLRQGR